MVKVQDLTGARLFSVVNWDMVKGALFAILAWLALSFPVAAEQIDAASTLGLYPSDIFSTVDSAVLVADLPMWTFLDGRLPGTSELGRMRLPIVDLTFGESQPNTDYSVAQIVVHANRGKNSGKDPKDAKDGKDSSSEVMSLQPSSPLHTSGEIGAFYGHSSGKFGGDDFGSYIAGGVGNDKVQINVGASYQEFNGRVPRWRP